MTKQADAKLTAEAHAPDRLDLRSHDIAADKLAQLLRAFPEARTEGGRINFERLRLAVGEAVDTGKERFGLTWPGKADCFKTIQRPSMGTLRPCPHESVNWDTTENLIIEGDNLEVLKLLQKSYLGKVKVIYIDPPYNTGNDFIYPDNFSESLQTYLEYTGQVDAEGKKFGTNTDADGRFHSKWMNMMYPRLYLARNLLRDDGAIFISISDVEVDNLRKICNEVFGEENFIATLVWEKSKKGDAKLIATTHEYVLVYSRAKAAIIERGVWRRKKDGADDVLEQYKAFRVEFGADHDAVAAAMRDWYAGLPKDDTRRKHQHYRWSDQRGLYFADNFHGPDDGRESRPRYDILHPTTGKPCKKPSTGWRWDEERTKAALAADPPLIHFGLDETTIPCRKSYLAEISHEPFASVFYRDGRAGTLEVEKLVAKGLVEFPKDKDVLADLIGLAADSDSVVLDFFAGSGTTAQAVLELNEQDGGKRKFVLVQLPERTGREDYPTIADICKERVRRVIKCLNDEDAGKLDLDGGAKPDRGFRVFKLAESNFTTWDSQVSHEEGSLLAQLERHVDHIADGRTPDDMLYELLLKSGFPLTTPVEKRTLAGKTVHVVAGGVLIICLERDVTLEIVRAIADAKPERVVVLDAGFAKNDQLKANAVLEFRDRGVTSFRTV